MYCFLNLGAALNLVQHIEKYLICVSSLCTSCDYLCRRLRNTNVLWQMDIRAQTGAPRKQWKRKWKRLHFAYFLNEQYQSERFCRREKGYGSAQRFAFVEMRCQRRQGFLRARHNMSPLLIISFSQMWSALNSLMLEKKNRLEASSRWNHSTPPWQTANHRTRIRHSLHFKSLPEGSNECTWMHPTKLCQFLIFTFYTAL